MSKTAVEYPIVMALKEAERFLGPDRRWKPVNQTQARFLNEFFERCRHETVPEIESVASREADEINTFLARRGFGLRIEPFGEQEFAAASVLDLLVEWTQPGCVTTIESKAGRKRTYPGVHLGSGVSIFRSTVHREPIARLATKAGDKVWITVLEHPKEGMDLVTLAENLAANSRTTDEFEGLKFPMVDLNQGVDIRWIELIETATLDGVPAWIKKALQQTKLRINERGARAESAALLEISGAWSIPFKPKPPLVIDHPFLVWFTRPGLAKPLFVGYITEEDWKSPGGITGNVRTLGDVDR